jgi:PHS family inorganic phosphate transporter-like MFS transporter
MLSVVFLAQSLGKLTAFGLTIAVISPLLSALSPPAATSADENRIVGAIDKAWRLVIISGSIPAIVALCFKLTIPESPRYMLDVLAQAPNPEDVKSMLSANLQTPLGKMLEDSSSRLTAKRDCDRSQEVLRNTAPWPSSSKLSDFLRGFFGFICQPKAWSILLSLSATWFFLDLAFYGLSMNASAFASEILWRTSTTPIQTTSQTLIAWRRQLFFELPFGAIIGSVITIFVLRRTGGQRIQMMGFAALTAIFLLTGTFYLTRDTATVRSKGTIYAMYFAAQLAFNLGNDIFFPTRDNTS